MPSARLSKRTADAAAPVAAVYILRDEDLAGFGLRVTPTGSKAWVVDFRPNGGGRKAPKRLMTLGSYGTLTAEEARRAAKDVLASVRLGADPAGARHKSRAMLTVAEFGERFLEQYCQPPRMKPTTAALYADNLRRLAKPFIGSIKLDAVTKADVARMHRAIGQDRPTSANNVLVTLASLYKFAAAEGLLPEGTNPARGVQRFKSQAMERFLSDEEFARLGEAIREAETIGLPWRQNELADPSKAKHRPKDPAKRMIILPPDVAAALRLLLFTGCRKSEILNLRWAEVDFERGLLNLEQSKTGRKTVVLNAPALQILSDMPRVGEHVFPGDDAKAPRSSVTAHWYRVRARAGLDGADGKPPVRLHDLRHTFASVGMSGGLGLPIVGKLLGHTQSSTTQRYAHLDADPVRRATERIGNAIAASLGDTPIATDNVRSLRSSQLISGKKLRK